MPNGKGQKGRILKKGGEPAQRRAVLQLLDAMSYE